MSARYGERRTTEHKRDDGSVVRITHVPGPYGGSTEYEVEGTQEQITAYVEGVLQSYPSNPYMTFFNWPPGLLIDWGPHKGEPNTHMAPTDLGEGRWIARGRHSNTSD